MVIEAKEISKVACCEISASTCELDEKALAAFRALGQPIRLQIFTIIASANSTVCSCDIEKSFDLTQPTISHHLRLLREAGLVDIEQRGTWIHYRARRYAIEYLAEYLKQLSRI